MHALAFHLLLLLLLRAVCIADAAAAGFNSKPSGGGGGGDFTTSASRSDIECAALCTAAAACNGIAFDAGTGVCRLATGSSVAESRGNGEVAFDKEASGRCFTRDGRRFLIIQQRVNENVLFNRTWSEYEDGFGDSENFWIGLKNIRSFTATTPRLLRVELLRWDSKFYFAEYSEFSVGNASSKYALNLNSYLSASSNTSYDALTYHKGRQFSTYDNDNDARSPASTSCSVSLGSAGWWFGSCCLANPNGVYYGSGVTDGERAAHWRHESNDQQSLKEIRMMLEMGCVEAG